jgi:hypothetical protein
LPLIKEFDLFVKRMANKKASGEGKMPADLFKSSPEISRKQAMIIVNLILAGRYGCKPADLEARVILLCRDASKHLCSGTL